MNLASITIKRPVATVMVLLIVVVMGFLAMVSIPMDLMPDFELPYAMVITSYPNSSPEETESMVTETIEASIASVEGLDGMMSYSMEGQSMVGVQFNFDTDMNFATLDMREKVAMVEDYLPDECSKPMILKLNMDMMPVMQIYVSSSTKNLAELTAMLNDEVAPRFERAKGVASVTKMGGVDEEISVELSQDKMGSYGLSTAMLSQLLAAENINLPGGNISKGSTDVIVRTTGKFKSVEDVKNLPLTLADRSIVRLGDIADVERKYADQENVTRIDGNTAVGIMISKASDANTLEVSKAVNRTLAKLEKEYPQLSFTVGYDSADYIRSSIRSVATSALYGAVLAIIVVFIFLRNIKATLIIGISIPTSLLAALWLMKSLNMTLNLITLCALTICVGMLVDNSIVVLENIFRLRQKLDDPEEAARKGSAEIFLAIVASTLTTVMVFLPIALSNGMASMVFGDFCWTIIIALMASLIVAVAVIPMLFSKVMHGSMNTTYIRVGERRYKYRLLNKFAKFIDSMKEGYGKLLPKALAHPKKFIVGCICIFLVSMLLIVTVGVEILPETDEGEVTISVEIPYGTSLADKDRILSGIEEYLLGMPEMKHLSATTGGMSQFSTNSNASINLILCDREKRSKSASELAAEIEDHFADLTEAHLTAQSSSSIGSMFGDYDITFLLKGDNLDKLEEIGKELEKQLKKMPEVQEAELQLNEGNPEIEVVIDRNTAAFYGVTAYQLASGLQSAVSGTKATRINIDGSELDVVLSVGGDLIGSAEDLKNVKITGNSGMSVPVGQIANLKYDNAPSYIYRENQVNTLSLNVDTGDSTLVSGSSDVVSFVENYPYPDGYFVEKSGSYDEMLDTFGDLLLALVAAVALVFLLLAAQFESVLMSFIVMMAVPFAMSGAFLVMFLTGTSLSLTSFLGLIMLVGIVVNNSILLVEFINQYKDSMGLSSALVKAGQQRLRPILMSATTTVVGMIPMSLGIGEGSEMLQPMAVSIIGGLIASTLVTLFLIPVIYSLIENRRLKKKAAKEAKWQHISELEAAWKAEDEAEAGVI